MRSSNKRSRSKSNRPQTLGNIVNRVFDSSGPEGKVRGTPQQIIEKFQLLARDAQLSNDRVAAENFQQHAEHYTRMLAQAQRELQAEQDARRQNQEERNRQFQDDRRQPQDGRAQQPSRRNDQRQPDDGDDYGKRQTGGGSQGAFAVRDVRDAEQESAALVETPESKASAGAEPTMTSSAEGTFSATEETPVASDEKPARPANRRKPRTAKGAADAPQEDGADRPKPKRAPRRPRKTEGGAETSPSTPSAAE